MISHAGRPVPRPHRTPRRSPRPETARRRRRAPAQVGVLRHHRRQVVSTGHLLGRASAASISMGNSRHLIGAPLSPATVGAALIFMPPDRLRLQVLHYGLCDSSCTSVWRGYLVSFRLSGGAGSVSSPSTSPQCELTQVLPGQQDRRTQQVDLQYSVSTSNRCQDSISRPTRGGSSGWYDCARATPPRRDTIQFRRNTDSKDAFVVGSVTVHWTEPVE